MTSRDRWRRAVREAGIGLSIWLLMLILSQVPSTGSLTLTFLAGVLVALPWLVISLQWATNTKRARMSIWLEPQGYVYSLLRNSTLLILLLVIVSIPTAIVMLMQFRMNSAMEWGILLVTSLIFPTFATMLQGEVPAGARHVAAAFIAAVICFLMGFVINTGLTYFEPTPDLASIAALQDELRIAGGSRVLYYMSDTMAWLRGIGIHLQDVIQHWNVYIAVLVGALLGFGSNLFFFMCLSGFRLNVDDIQRTIAPIGVDPKSIQITTSRAVVLGFLYMLGLCISYSVALSAEYFAQQNDAGLSAVVVERDEVTQKIFPKSLTLQVEEIRNAFRPAFRLAQDEAVKAAEKAYAGGGAGVDLYLDWYYSLLAEYARIAMLLQGDLDQQLKQEFSKHFDSALDQKAVADLDKAINRLDELITQYNSKLQSLKQPTSTAGAPPFSEADLQALMVPSVYQRVGISFATGVATSLGMAVATHAATSSFQIAAAYIAKASVGKVAATGIAQIGAALAGGGVTGAAVGSLVPGAGTALGAVAGAVIGVGTFFATDAALLKGEEYLNRDEMKANLLKDVESHKSQFIEGLKSPLI